LRRRPNHIKEPEIESCSLTGRRRFSNKYEAEVVIPAEAEKEAKELKAKGEAARILERMFSIHHKAGLTHYFKRISDLRAVRAASS